MCVFAVPTARSDQVTEKAAFSWNEAGGKVLCCAARSQVVSKILTIGYHGPDHAILTHSVSTKADFGIRFATPSSACEERLVMRKILLATVAAMGIAGASSAGATVVMTSGSGNDCSGAFGTSPTCVAPNGSPQIVKFDYDNDGNISVTSINPAFPTIDGSEFTINLAAGTWSYIPGLGDPGVTAWSAKGGPGYNLYVSDTAVTSGTFVTPLTPGGPSGLSHITFFDTALPPPPPPPPPPIDPIPEPASLALLGLGLAGLGVAMRRRRRNG
jgi:hypothetical protein